MSESYSADDLALLVPMLRLLEQALQHLVEAHTRHELGAILLAYVLDRLAAVNLSPRRLQELCRASRGCSPMDLLRQQRLALLAQQLRDPACAQRSLRGLMDALHLSDSASTSQAFARQYGCSPADYRRGGRAGAPV